MTQAAPPHITDYREPTDILSITLAAVKDFVYRGKLKPVIPYSTDRNKAEPRIFVRETNFAKVPLYVKNI